MTTGMVNLQNCPRDVESLLQIKRGIRYRLGLQIQMFSNNNEEQGFLSAADDVQAQGLSAALQAYDANGGAAASQVAAPAPQTAMQPQQAAPQQAAPAMPPQLPQAQVPMNMQVVGTQQVMAPHQPQMPQQPPQPQMPQQQPQPVMVPTQPQQPQQPMMPQQPQQPPQQPMMPQQPVMPPAPQQQPAPAPQPQPQAQQFVAPPPQPVTTSDPGNAGAGLGASIPQKLDGLIKAMKKVAEVGESNQEWIEEIHDHSLGNSRVLHTLLLMQLVIIEQQGLDPSMLVKLMLSKPQETVETFLETFAEEEEEEEGKG